MSKKPSLGVCYYPEHWDSNMWENDIKKMLYLGISYVRIGEFAWSKIQPLENTFNFGWLDDIINLLSKNNLMIILGTPTATPPIWVVEKHPDIFALDKFGHIRGFGSRRHYCFSHNGYIKECKKIAQILAKRYAKNPNIVAWQIDNEYGCHDTTLSYSNNALNAFRKWLKKKYKNIQSLNKAWGCVFWSMEYNNFNQITLPNLSVTTPNPSALLDFRRFSSLQVVKFNQAQVNILRKYTKAPLLHNYMGKTLDFDHFKLAKNLDIASFDNYPLGFLEEIVKSSNKHKRKYIFQGDPDFQAFHHDLYYSVGNGKYWIMEQQIRAVNWAKNNPSPNKGMLKLWTFEAMAHGASLVSYFRFRQALFASEQMHTGLMLPDNSNSSSIKDIINIKNELPNVDFTRTFAKVAIVFDYESSWAFDIQKQGEHFDYFEIIFDIYKTLRKLGLDVDILDSNISSFNPYKLVFIPSLMHLNKNLKKAINAFKNKILLGPRFNSKDSNMHISIKNNDIKNLDFKVNDVSSLNKNISIKLKNGGGVKYWLEDISYGKNITLLESTVDDKPILIYNKNRYYLAALLDKKALFKTIKNICKDANIKTINLPSGLRIKNTKKYKFIFNYTNSDIIFDDITIKSCGVHYQKNN